MRREERKTRRRGKRNKVRVEQRDEREKKDRGIGERG